MSDLDDATHDRLMKVSSATLTTVMFKRGLKNIFLQGVIRLRPGPNMVGPAVTLRYIPAREDLDHLGTSLAVDLRAGSHQSKRTAETGWHQLFINRSGNARHPLAPRKPRRRRSTPGWATRRAGERPRVARQAARLRAARCN